MLINKRHQILERLVQQLIIPCPSTTNGLLYTFAKDSKSWFFATIDFNNEKITEKVRVSTTGVLAGSLANNFFSGAGIGFDVSTYVPTIGGMTVWRASRRNNA